MQSLISSFFLDIKRIDASAELILNYIQSFASTASRYSLRTTNSYSDKAYNNL